LPILITGIIYSRNIETLREKYEELNEPLFKIVDGEEKEDADDTEIREYDDEDDEDEGVEVIVSKTDPKPTNDKVTKPADIAVEEKKDTKTNDSTIRRKNRNYLFAF